MERNVRLMVSGSVQSVGYRMFIHKAAGELNLSGGVRNLMDGSVEIEVQGSSGMIDELVKRAERGPGRSSVTKVMVEELSLDPLKKGFSIR